MKIKTNAKVSFTRTLLLYRIQFLLSVAQDGEDEKGLKLQKIGQLFQIWMQFNPKMAKILIWIAIPDKINLMFSFSF